MEYRGEGEKKVSDRSVPSIQFGIFLSTIFDEWVEEDIGRVKVQVYKYEKSRFRQHNF